MAGVRSPWHALRPVFLAGTATFAWLTFSSSPASADLLPQPTPVVNEISVNAPSTDLLDPVAGVAPGNGPATPVTAIADDAVDPVAAPPGNRLVEATEPVIAPVVESAEPALAPVEPVLASLVEPVMELATALEPVVALAPQAPVQAVIGLLPDSDTAPAATVPAVGGTPAAGPVPTPAAPRPSLDAAGPASFAARAVAVAANPLLAASSASVESAENAPVPPSSPPPPVPMAPGSGGAASGGPSPGSAAWLSPLPLVLHLLGAASAPDFVLHAPEPVSFDPGSSPD